MMQKSTLLQTMSAVVLCAALMTAFFISPFNAAAANTYSGQLNGASNQYFSATDSSSLSVTGDITVEAWIKPASMPSGVSEYIAAKGSTNGYNAWRLMSAWNSATSKHNLHFEIDKTGSNTVAVAYSYADVDLASYVGTWVHVAATWNATSGTAAPKLYINGSEVASYSIQGNDGGANAIADTDSPTYIGNSPTDALYFDGKIDDVRIYNTERSASAILSDYQQELNGNESGLVAYWKLNNGLTDSTTNGNTLTNNNGATFSTDVPFVNDTTPPSVSVTFPTNGYTASSTISLAANASDDVAIAGVQFSVDGSNFGSEDTSSPYSVSLDTTTLTNASHTVAARARDISGNLATSTTVNFTVNNVAPFVPILKVRQGTPVSGTGTQLRDDTQLKLHVDAGKTYIIDGAILASATGATPDIKIAFITPSGTTMDIGYDQTNINGILSTSGVASVALPLPANTPRAIQISGTIVTTTAGDMILQWGQNASSTQQTTVRAGSYLRAEEI